MPISALDKPLTPEEEWDVFGHSDQSLEGIQADYFCNEERCQELVAHASGCELTSEAIQRLARFGRDIKKGDKADLVDIYDALSDLEQNMQSVALDLALDEVK